MKLTGLCSTTVSLKVQIFSWTRQFDCFPWLYLKQGAYFVVLWIVFNGWLISANTHYSNMDSESNLQSSRKSQKMFGDFNNFRAGVLFNLLRTYGHSWTSTKTQKPFMVNGTGHMILELKFAFWVLCMKCIQALSQRQILIVSQSVSQSVSGLLWGRDDTWQISEV